MAIQQKKKLTYKEIMAILNQMAITINTVEMLANNYGKILDDYIDYQENKEDFIKFLEKKYKEKEDATEVHKEGQSDKEAEEEKKEIDDRDNKTAEDQ